MPTFMTFLFRIFLIAAGLMFAVGMAVAALLLLVVWSVRAVWAKLTGRPVLPFVMGIDPRSGFERVYRKARQRSPTPRADAVRSGRNISEVTDVEARLPRG